MAGSDVFGREPLQIGGAMAAESIMLKFTKGGDYGIGEDSKLLIQNVNIQYMQPISRLFGLETRNVFFVVGRPNGSFGASHIIGISGTMKAFFKQFGDVCKLVPQGTRAAAGNNLSLSVNKYSGCNEAESDAGMQLTLGNLLVHTINIQAAVGQNFVMTDAFNAEFTKLIWS